ncbi:ubiquitin-associated protein 2-like isoform X1 [Astyanax mexicanus]|uniref:Ubiquitin associated protein 2-like n=1 Tax=Astyanax mexicanus TaxID=7994 RepID=A0A3B1IRU7_ASTMX|nr:ubiquitin-associated protein 2-like isoform X1 [Astyanax mexicanus]XP_049332192.1 ubiquitin-associated protein 2-like isoform X1 [Astyanax mexicanus]
MMTSVGSSRNRGNWEQQTQGQTQSQSQHKQRPQATAEQIRLAQMISDHNDADFEEKVKQLSDITGKDQDESMIALHDCNGDVNRAINVLLEGSPDTDSWEMVGKKKGVSGQKESGQTDGGEEGKENRERGGERDVARRRGGAPRRGRGASRGREFRGQENGLDGSKTGGVAGRGTERGRRGRGRGRGGAGRRGGRFSAQGMGQLDKGPRYDLSGDESTFNPADYAEPAQTEESYAGGSTWSNTGNLEPEDGATGLEFTGGEGTNYPQKFDSAPGAWRTATEEWGTEDWNEDLSETKIFTASSVATMPMPQENVTITAGQRIDLAVLLGKTPPSSSSETEAAPLEAPQPQSLSQSLVFSNSKQPASLSQPSSSSSYSSHSVVSMLSKGFGEVGDSKGNNGSSTSGSQFLEQFKTAQALAQLAAQHSQSGPPNTGPSTWDTSPAALGQYDIKSQTDSLVHSPFTKRQPYQPTSTASSMMDAFLQDKVPPSTSSLPSQAAPSSSLAQTVSTPLPKPPGPASSQQMSPGPADPQASSPLPLQQHKLKQQKKRTSIATKIPALAVEMPGSADISGLNLQFGALQFGSEPVLPEYDSTASVTTTASANTAQNSLSEQAPALSNPTQMDLYEQRTSQTRRYPPSLSSSPQKDMQTKNGFTSIQTTQSLEAAAGSALSVKPTSDAVPPSTVSNIVSLTDTASGPTSLLTTSHQTPLAALGHEDPSSNSIPPPQHNNSIPTQQNSLTSSGRTNNTSLLHSSVDGDSSLHSSSFSSVSAVAPSVVPSSAPSSSSTAPVSHSAPVPPASSSVSAVSAQSGLGPVSSLTMGLNSTGGVTSIVPPTAVAAASSSVASATAAPSSASSSRSTAASGKAPPNLPPGVPPLLPNPYIMAPGLLHAYPPQVYGYDDLQMLQTRIPLDYYSIPFATPTTALTGREGSLTSNPYSAGDLTKFGRGDTSSPAPATTLAQPQQSQTQTHHTTQQPFLNPALPPGYSYTSLPYYTGVPGLPNTFQYGPAMFPVAPTSSKQHGVNVGVNASATPFQQASGYGSHGYSTGYEDLGQASAGSGDFCKGGYGTAVAAAAAAAAAAASAQNKPASSVTAPGVGFPSGVSVTSSNTGVPDISGSVYTKTQSFDKQGFHTGTPGASFSLPSALGSGGPINPPAAAGYAPAPFMHILAPHQQPHSQMLHHHLQQDGQSGSGQRSQNASIQQKSQINKSAYNSYNWGGN